MSKFAIMFIYGIIDVSNHLMYAKIVINSH